MNVRWNNSSYLTFSSFVCKPSTLSLWILTCSSEIKVWKRSLKECIKLNKFYVNLLFEFRSTFMKILFIKYIILNDSHSVKVHWSLWLNSYLNTVLNYICYWYRKPLRKKFLLLKCFLTKKPWPLRKNYCPPPLVENLDQIFFEILKNLFISSWKALCEKIVI